MRDWWIHGQYCPFRHWHKVTTRLMNARCPHEVVIKINGFLKYAFLKEKSEVVEDA